MQPHPGIDLDASQALFPEGRHVGQQGRALGRGDAQDADLARLGEAQEGRDAAAIELDGARNDVAHCLGAALARMEGQIAFATLLDRFPRLELAGTPERRPTFTLRGLETLPVALA